jgi:acyl-coenzyme A thioesterase PaaI-like protein
MTMALISVLPVGTPFGILEAKINFMLPMYKGELLAEGKIVHKGSSTAVLEATAFKIIEGEQHAIARILGRFWVRSVALVQIISNRKHTEGRDSKMQIR